MSHQTRSEPNDETKIENPPSVKDMHKGWALITMLECRYASKYDVPLSCTKYGYLPILYIESLTRYNNEKENKGTKSATKNAIPTQLDAQSREVFRAVEFLHECKLSPDAPEAEVNAVRSQLSTESLKRYLAIALQTIQDAWSECSHIKDALSTQFCPFIFQELTGSFMDMLGGKWAQEIHQDLDDKGQTMGIDWKARCLLWVSKLTQSCVSVKQVHGASVCEHAGLCVGMKTAMQHVIESHIKTAVNNNVVMDEAVKSFKACSICGRFVSHIKDEDTQRQAIHILLQSIQNGLLLPQPKDFRSAYVSIMEDYGQAAGCIEHK